MFGSAMVDVEPGDRLQGHLQFYVGPLFVTTSLTQTLFICS
jgi:hypothetical protein